MVLHLTHGPLLTVLFADLFVVNNPDIMNCITDMQTLALLGTHSNNSATLLRTFAMNNKEIFYVSCEVKCSRNQDKNDCYMLHRHNVKHTLLFILYIFSQISK